MMIRTVALFALAKAAQHFGVKRFIFMSSISVVCGHPANITITDETTPAPISEYGTSKLSGEYGLSKLDFEWIALRPTVIYGPHAKGNLALVLKLARAPFPLPIASLTGRRSLLSIDNLVSVIGFLLERNDVWRRPFVVADRENITVPEMIATIRSALDRPPAIFSLPSVVMSGLCKAVGKSGYFERLNGNLIVEATVLDRLGWQPPLRTTVGLTRWAKFWRQ